MKEECYEVDWLFLETASREKLIAFKSSFSCFLSVKKRRNWHRHDYSEIDDGSKVTSS